ncbi:MAG: hypothetical protein MRY83_22975 [Flavobacteriales bacterium]|nr:hypothetical protein [Flavobacteriales bacterium]
MSDNVLDQNVLDSAQDFSYPQRFQELMDNGYTVDIGQTLNKAWAVLNKDIGSFIGYTAILLAINVVLGLIPFVGSLASIVLNAPLGIGFAIVTSKILNDEPYTFNDFFKGFDYVGQLFLGGLVSGIFVIIGCFLLLIPGIYLGIAYSWVSIIIVFAGYEFWDAMETSRKVITKKWFWFLLFMFVFGLINVAGALVCGLGLLITMPLTSIAMFVLFNDIVHGGVSSDLPTKDHEFSS